MRIFSTSLYAYIDNELFKLKQFKDLQFENIEKATNEMIESILDIKNHITSNLETEYKELFSFLKKAQIQFSKGITFFDNTLRSIHPNDKLTKSELQNLEKKLRNFNSLETEKFISQVSVIKIAEDFNFKQIVEKNIINSAFT